MSESDDDNTTDPPMHHREITLADGRYMIFYTFGEDTGSDDTENEQGDDV